MTMQQEAQRMTTPTSIPGATVEAVDAPPIPGLTFRHATAADWPAIADIDNRAHRADGTDEQRSAESLAADYEPRDHFQLERDLVIAEIDREPVAYHVGYRVMRGQVMALETTGAVLPVHRGRGIGTALLRTTQTRLAAEAAADPRPGARELRTWALETEAVSRALITAEGYVPIRFGFEMRRPITGTLPEHPLPEGIELRPVTPDQHRAIYDADNEAFQDHWGHRTQDEGDFAAMFDHPETDTSLWCVAWDGDQVAGSVMNAILTAENEALGVRRGWLEHVSVRRQWRGRGVAKALCAASFRVLRDHGMDEAWLGVDGSNPTGALQLYEGLGFHVAHRWSAYGRPLDRPAPAGWRPADEG